MNLKQMEADVRKLKKQVASMGNTTIEGYSRSDSVSGVAFGQGQRTDPLMTVVRQFWIEDEDFADTVLCRVTETGGGVEHVAKPYLLRRTPFHNKSRDGIDYVYTETMKRTAKKTVAGNPPTTTEEKQVIVPKYVAGDVIYAINRIFGRDAFLKDVDGSSRFTLWVDLNIDGRYWAKASA